MNYLQTGDVYPSTNYKETNTNKKHKIKNIKY